jgi:hypothetical protein
MYIFAQHRAGSVIKFRAWLELAHAFSHWFLAHKQPTVFDWLPKVNGTYGIHSCTGPGNYEFTRDSV